MKIAKIKIFLKKVGIAIIAVLVASLIRKFLLNSLEEKVIWITFYPAVMIAAILGGFFSGLLTSIFTILIVLFEWHLFIDHPFINDSIGTISTVVFLINCIIISGISEYSRQQKLNANIQKEKAEQANKAKSKFLANISHELRTPLNAILGFTSLMQENQNIPDEEQKNLKIINSSGKHLLNLINNVLDIAKIESGKTTKIETSFNIENTVYEVSQMMTQYAESKNIKLKIIFDKDIPQYIKTDRQKLKQILINLVGNAIKFTNTGTITLSVKKEIQNEFNFLMFEVDDTGIGIDEKDFKKIFTPFSQKTTISKQKGTGLGLSISKQYAELLGGSITVESEIGVGSKFSITIPLSITTKEDFTNENNKYMNVKSIIQGQSNFRILIVEDQIENWLLLKRVHEKIGIQVKIAKNGLQGVELFKEWQPHLIWMDIRMPIMDGLEATKEIRLAKNGKDVKIIGVSAHVFKDEIQNIMSVGMDSFIKKPYQFHQIYKCLNEQLKIKFTFNNNEIKITQKQLSSKMLDRISQQKLKDLEKAIKNLNNKQIESAINQIQKTDIETAQTILYYTKKLKYSEIYRIINSYLNNE